MNSNKALLLSTTVAFVGGFVAGVLYQTDPCRRFRTSVGVSARERTRWLEQQFTSLENQLSQVEEQLHRLGDEFGHRMREAVRLNLADLESEEKWDVEDREVERDLPRMPKS
ncbi:MAG: hypothetical protein ACOCTG_03850 [Bacteroidota bacterium]